MAAEEKTTLSQAEIVARPAKTVSQHLEEVKLAADVAQRLTNPAPSVHRVARLTSYLEGFDYLGGGAEVADAPRVARLPSIERSKRKIGSRLKRVMDIAGVTIAGVEVAQPPLEIVVQAAGRVARPLARAKIARAADPRTVMLGKLLTPSKVTIKRQIKGTIKRQDGTVITYPEKDSSEND